MLSEHARAVLTDKKWEDYLARGFAQMTALFETDEVGPMVLYGFCGRDEYDETGVPHWGNGLDNKEVRPEVALERDLEKAAWYIPQLVTDKWFVPICVERGFYGVHLVDKFLGGDVILKDGQFHTNYLQTEVGELKRPNLDDQFAWVMLKRYAQAFVDSGATVPILGVPCVASPLNIALNLYGGEFLIAMLEDPDAAKHDLEVITSVQMEIHQWYKDHIPAHQLQCVVSYGRTQPPGYGQICGCSTQLVSPELYEEFIMPHDDALLGIYGKGGMIHLCGSHEHLIPLFAKMKNLKSVQLNDRAAEGLEAYVKGLRDDQVIYLNPCEGMPLEKGLEIAKGRKLVVVANVELETGRIR